MINGNPNPTVGKDEYYTLVDYSLGLAYLDVSSKYIWRIKKKVRGMWKDITKEPPKTGISVPFKFGEAVIGAEFTIEVYKETKNIFTQKNETHKMGEIIVIPKSSKAPKITKVVLFNRGARDINKASYTDRLIARAYCVGMFNQTIDFHLWEDDAAGGGHHAGINKNNRSNRVYSAKVNRDGIAEVEISLSADQRVLRQIANRMMMSGDKDEGKYHEFYVTASYEGKILKANERNVAVENPDYKQKPKEYTPKFPATPASRTPTHHDEEDKIKAAYFVNDKNQKLVKTTVGEEVKVQIITQGMVGKHLQYRVWEYDAGKHDEIYSSPRLKVVGNIMTHVSGFKITKERFQKGVDLPYGDPDEQVQNYFIEVLPLDISVSSKKFGIDTSVGLMTVAVEKTRTPTKVGETKKKEEKGTCVCKQYDLVWGNKVSCEFRKKVVEICAELWGENRKIEMANGLMAVMNVETAGSFKAHHREGYKTANESPKELTISSFHKNGNTKSSRAIGLIQFTQEALEGMGEFPKATESSRGTQARFDALNKLKLSYAQMGEIKQLEKVKKYFEPVRNRVKTPEDIYLQVFAPDGVGKKDDFILYRGGTDEYESNVSVDINSKGKYKNDNNIQRSEILERFHDSKDKGKENKADKFICSSSKKESNIGLEDIVTYHIYANGEIEKHIPKKIKSGYEKKYRYVYHDQNKKEHQICVVDFVLADKRGNGSLIDNIPKGYINSYDYPKGGNAQTAYVYSNGDICVKGTRYGLRKYPKLTGKVELVRMKDNLSYEKDNIKVYYSFRSSQRRYCNPETYAGFIGVLAELGREDILCTGMCFEDATSYPSLTHPNGDSADTAYYSTLELEQKKLMLSKNFILKIYFEEKEVGILN
ncbi:hypothetical protein [Bergeyella zoohelcum]|uniref:Transglycosylase SLT domain-containing protein n=1 Tax=Bergeyella zoohelcum TaxID=1015 RepID=A0A380ZWW9_9FLAO|nr:hypothetical protein [Bergeyella zoohelcum]SUV53256.1 Uncharacterised protein [Bergeyella zoohelcum]